jgi:putative two-component system response regulator
MGSDDELLDRIDHLQTEFIETTEKLKKDIKRHGRIMARADRQQQRDYDTLQQKLLEVEVLKREIEDTQKEVIFRMGAIGESRSRETGNHVKRVAEYSKLFALYYGLSKDEAETLKQASPMHDIGKVAIPDAILNKPGRFNEEERRVMDTHAQLGYDMLKGSNRKLLNMAATIAYEHHEKWNGKGYPRGLKGEEISIFGRITAIADVFDALGSDRVYKKAWSDERIFKLLKEERGEHFDPKLVDIFFNNLSQFLEIRTTFADEVG